jgi:hypothetical protein
MTVGEALRAALVDFYRESWKLVFLNSAFSLAALAVCLAALYALPALPLVLLLGPLAAALMHCAITLARTEELAFEDAVEGVRLHWRRGLALATVSGAAVALGVVAIRFYAGKGSLIFPLAVVVFYLLALFAVLQLWLWPLAVLERERPLRAVAREAGLAMVHRPAASTGLAAALLGVNAFGAAAGILPLLTLTIAYSFLAAARFALAASELSVSPSVDERHEWQA